MNLTVNCCRHVLPSCRSINLPLLHDLLVLAGRHMQKHSRDKGHKLLSNTGFCRMVSISGDLSPANSSAGVVNAIMRFVYGLLAEVPMWSLERMASSNRRNLDSLVSDGTQFDFCLCVVGVCSRGLIAVLVMLPITYGANTPDFVNNFMLLDTPLGASHGQCCWVTVWSAVASVF